MVGAGAGSLLCPPCGHGNSVDEKYHSRKQTLGTRNSGYHMFQSRQCGYCCPNIFPARPCAPLAQGLGGLPAPWGLSLAPALCFSGPHLASIILLGVPAPIFSQPGELSSVPQEPTASWGSQNQPAGGRGWGQCLADTGPFSGKILSEFLLSGP